MSNLLQTIINTFIRVTAVFRVALKFVFDSFKGFFTSFAKVIGFSPSNYYLESDEAQSVKRMEAKPQVENKSANNSSSTNTNRRKKAKIDDYFLNMAREVEHPSK